MFLRLLARAPLMLDSFLGAARPRRLGVVIASSPVRYAMVATRALSSSASWVRASLDDVVAAVRTGAGAQIDHVVGGADRVLVVLHDQHGVAEVAQATGCDQLAVVALVQADGRLVQDVHTPTRLEPICVASRMRWASPPDSVAAGGRA